MNLEKDTWSVIANYFDSVPNYITKHHLDSYNDFVNNKIYDIFNNKQFNPQVVVLIDKENPDITYLINVYYGGRNKDKIEISRPIIYNALKEEVKPMYPNEARLKNLTYAFNVFCDIEVEYIIKEKDTVIFHEFSSDKFSKINIGRVPIMLHSNLCSLSGMSREFLKKVGECPYDHGGYFIIDGREKVCVSRERKSENILYINKSGNPDFIWSAEVKSVPAEFRYARNTYLHVILQNGEIVVENPYFKSGKSDTGSKYIPLFVLFRVLGIETDKEILEMIFHNLDKTNEFANQGLRLLTPSINSEDNKLIYDQMTALKYLEKFIKNMEQGEGGDIQRNRVERFALLYKNIYDNLFPHVGNDFREKALYLGYCVNQLLQVMLGIKEETDRDSFEYKRIDLSGFMIANLFRDGFSQLLYDARNKISSAFEFGYIDYKGKSIVNIISEYVGNLLL
jgi:DNA-directed RNA polymerase II subunit RPB2